MDLFAYCIGNKEPMLDYINKYYSGVPRFRGARLMKFEEPITEKNGKPTTDVTDMFPSPNDEEIDYSEVNDMFNKYVGQDVIYIHTRCGSCGDYDDPLNNYISCGAKDWEEKYKDLFLEHITDPFDSTYCTHFFKVVPGKDYDALCKWWLEDEE